MTTVALRRAIAAATLFIAAPAAMRAQGTGTGGALSVQAGVKVSADTVRVGDPFLVVVAIRAPRGATIIFPDPPDSTRAVQGLDPVRVEDGADSTALTQTATYRVAAWDVAAQPLVFGDAVVRLGRAERRVPVSAGQVFVASVLPADSALRVPKPPRPIYEMGITRWWLYALAALLLALLVLAWWLWRRRQRPLAAAVPADPYERAAREFERIEQLRLIDAGERGRHVALMVEALRDYVAARYANASLALTTSEVGAAIRDVATLPRERLLALLSEADLIKFARRPVSAERARELGREARAIVDHEREASRLVVTPVDRKAA